MRVCVCVCVCVLREERMREEAERTLTAVLECVFAAMNNAGLTNHEHMRP